MKKIISIMLCLMLAFSSGAMVFASSAIPDKTAGYSDMVTDSGFVVKASDVKTLLTNGFDREDINVLGPDAPIVANLIRDNDFTEEELAVLKEGWTTNRPESVNHFAPEEGSPIADTLTRYDGEAVQFLLQNGVDEQKILQIDPVTVKSLLLQAKANKFTKEQIQAYVDGLINYKAQETGPEFQEQIEFKMPLPRDITETQFNQEVYAEYITGSKSERYSMKGVPFLFQNVTYIPVRDIAEAFGIEVTYNESDRFVAMRTNDKSMFISPDITNIGRFTTYYEIGKFSPMFGIVRYRDGKQDDLRNEYEGTHKGYIRVEGRSYVPVREILEFFGFDVNYDKEAKTVMLTGNRLQGGNLAPLFSPEQTKIINAMSSYESARTATFEFAGSIANAVMKKTVTEFDVKTIYSVTESDGTKYDTSNYTMAISINDVRYPVAGGSGGNIEKPGERMNGPDWRCVIAETYLSGGNKYKEMQIQKTGETDGLETYEISFIEGTAVDVTVEIEKGNGKLYSYSSKTDGKSFIVKY